MITADYVRVMARYNAWQNQQLTLLLKEQPDEVLRMDRGAFFGSIFASLNHLLWGDRMWMSRFDTESQKPDGGIADSTALTPTFGVWSADRFKTDGRIKLWADRLKTVDLIGELRWYSGALGRDVSKPMTLCVAHMFNHQTHHRGQVHAMMTAAGLEAPVTDLFAMPETL
ncbi:MAG: DinB family protein [Pseudomonadota bacterium]